MEARVAVLEQIARNTSAAIERLDRRLDAVERRLDTMITYQCAEFRWLLGIMLGGFATMLAGFAGMLGEMAHGFHWL